MYKQGLCTLLQDSDESRYLFGQIQNLVSALSLAGLEASRLLQLHLQLQLERGLEIPSITETYLRQFFSLVLGAGRLGPVDTEIKKSFDVNYKPLRSGTLRPPAYSNGIYQSLTYFIKGYKVNLDNHLEKQWKTAAKKHARFLSFRV